MEVLADQAGADDVLTFTFSRPVDLVIVHSVGSESRATGPNQTPTAGFGKRCPDDIPIWLPARMINGGGETVVKVYAATGTVVSVEGYFYS
jgi:hypothetical protein